MFPNLPYSSTLNQISNISSRNRSFSSKLTQLTSHPYPSTERAPLSRTNSRNILPPKGGAMIFRIQPQMWGIRCEIHIMGQLFIQPSKLTSDSQQTTQVLRTWRRHIGDPKVYLCVQCLNKIWEVFSQYSMRLLQYYSNISS